jgi:YVTN family beta-propeller protein
LLVKLAAALFSVAILALPGCPAGVNGAIQSGTSFLRAVQDIPRQGDTSRFDYENFDPETHLLHIAHLGAGTVTVYDTRNGAVTGTISKVPGVHGVLAVPELGRVFATATDNNQVAAIDPSTLGVVVTAPAGTYPDGLAYDPDVAKLHVSDEQGGTDTVLDARTLQVLAVSRSGADVGNTQYDPGSQRILVAVGAKNQLLAIDPATDQVVTSFDTSGCDEPHGLVRDLVWRTIGRVNDAKLVQAAAHIYRPAEGRRAVTPPDRVLAIGVLRRNQTRALFNEGSFVPFAIELDVAKGTCEARYAYEKGSTMAISERKPLPDVLTKRASQGPIQLSTDLRARRDRRRERASQFFHETITDFCRRSERPLLLIDAVACREVWAWVSDTRLDAENVTINAHTHVEVDWGDLRIVRIRTDNAPKVLFDHVVEGVGTASGERVVFPAPHGADADLFRVMDTPAPVYFSFGSL